MVVDVRFLFLDGLNLCMYVLLKWLFPYPINAPNQPNSEFLIGIAEWDR